MTRPAGKCYDVHWLAFGSPENLIDLLGYLGADRRNSVVTPFGLTETYNVGSGLDQGGVECPLLWRIAYDVLLRALDEQGNGYTLSAQFPSHDGSGDRLTLRVDAAAYVDDTTIIARSRRRRMQDSLAISEEFMALNGIEANAKKFRVLVVNPAAGSLCVPLTFDGVDLPVTPPPPMVNACWAATSAPTAVVPRNARSLTRRWLASRSY